MTLTERIQQHENKSYQKNDKILSKKLNSFRIFVQGHFLHEYLIKNKDRLNNTVLLHHLISLMARSCLK